MAITNISRLDGLEDLDGFIIKLYEMKDAKVYKKRAKKNATSLVWHMNWLKKFILII